MARNRARLLQIESLEGKQLLSTLHPGGHATPKPAALVLDGTLKGVWGQRVQTTIGNNADSLNRSDEPVSGTIRSLGPVRAHVIEEVNFHGVNPNSSVTDKIVLEGARGTVTLSYGPHAESEKVTPQSVSSVFRYTVVSGTGAYAGASGTGTVTWTDPSAGWGTPSTMMTYRLHSNRSS